MRLGIRGAQAPPAFGVAKPDQAATRRGLQDVRHPSRAEGGKIPRVWASAQFGMVALRFSLFGPGSSSRRLLQSLQRLGSFAATQQGRVRAPARLFALRP